mgnify:CR=1 FL=1
MRRSGAAALAEKVLGEPRYMPTIIADKTTAMVVVQSVLAALFHRERSGEGQEIEVPMYESMVSFVMTEHLWGQSFEPPLDKAGYVRLMAKHRRPYKTRDGQYLAVLPYWDNHWRTFCDIAGRPELAEDPRFIDMATRLKNINESYRVTGEIIASRSREEWLEALGDTNVPMMVVNSLDELIDDPHLVATGFWQEMVRSLRKVGGFQSIAALRLLLGGWVTDARMHREEVRPCLLGCGEGRDELPH